MSFSKLYRHFHSFLLVEKYDAKCSICPIFGHRGCDILQKYIPLLHNFNTIYGREDKV